MQNAESGMKSASAWIPAAEAITAHIGQSSTVTDMPLHTSHKDDANMHEAGPQLTAGVQ
jgi:hypothetical protein